MGGLLGKVVGEEVMMERVGGDIKRLNILCAVQPDARPSSLTLRRAGESETTGSSPKADGKEIIRAVGSISRFFRLQGVGKWGDT